MKYFLNKSLFLERRQAITREKLGKPENLDKFIKIRRLPEPLGDFAGLHNRNFF